MPEVHNMQVSSPAFKNEEHIPSQYTCEGDNVNPPIAVNNIPEGAKCLALLMEDPDAPVKTFDHWIMWNIPIGDGIRENSAPGIEGRNSAGKDHYHGPCPPQGTHRYYFHVYALNQLLELDPGSDRKTFENAIRDHIIGKGTLMGRYHKKQ
jgi:hypothetical protein